MSIQHIILGYLNTGSYTGYDLKKAIAAHPILPWSGNNNQIYKALLELQAQGFIVSESVIQNRAPNKKIYSITHAGRALLRDWLLEPFTPSESYHPLLVKLQFADVLKPADWYELLAQYQQELQYRQSMQKKMSLPRLRSLTSHGTSSDLLAEHFNKMVVKYELDRHDAEIKLVNQFLDLIGGKVRLEPGKKESEQDEIRSIVYPVAGPVFDRLSIHKLEVDDVLVLELTSDVPAIGSEQDAVDLLALCGEHEAEGILASTNLFQDDFFRLKTGLAGAILQKLVNYRVRVALFRAPDHKIKGKFIDFLSESNHGQHFAVLADRDEAIHWLTR